MGATSATALGLTFALALSIGTVALAITASQIDDSTNTGKLTKMLLEVLTTILGGVALGLFLKTLPGIATATAFSVSMGLALVVTSIFLRNTANSIELDSANSFLMVLILDTISTLLMGAVITKLATKAGMTSGALSLGFGISLVITGITMMSTATQAGIPDGWDLLKFIAGAIATGFGISMLLPLVGVSGVTAGVIGLSVGLFLTFYVVGSRVEEDLKAEGYNTEYLNDTLTGGFGYWIYEKYLDWTGQDNTPDTPPTDIKIQVDGETIASASVSGAGGLSRRTGR